MKLIIAMIQPEKLPSVKEALYEADVKKMTVTNALGCGQQLGYSETFRGSKAEINLLKKVRMDIAVNDEFVERTLDAIIKGARSEPDGKIGDGKILVVPLEECIRIRSREKGNKAIG